MKKKRNYRKSTFNPFMGLKEMGIEVAPRPEKTLGEKLAQELLEYFHPPTKGETFIDAVRRQKSLLGDSVADLIVREDKTARIIFVKKFRGDSPEFLDIWMDSFGSIRKRRGVYPPLSRRKKRK